MKCSDAVPSAADQLLFLSRVQRLLDSGRFSATYKFALFLALADLAVALGNDSGASLRIPLDVLAERFLSLYWRQASPYPAARNAIILRQNAGNNAEILTKIAEAHASLGLSLGEAKSRPGWRALVRASQRIILKMPLLKLQTIGSEGTASRAECFLYPNSISDEAIELLPGVAYCLRRFFPLLQGMVKAKWLGWVQSQNKDSLGAVQDLESFMFGANRTDTRRMRTVLLEIQDGRCFYQPRTRLDPATAHVDHFIPWAKYPCDSATNFVLASPRANSAKKDHLPTTEYLGRWIDRNTAHGRELATAAIAAGLDCEDGIVERVAAWAYGNHEAIGGLVWHATRGLLPLTSDWKQLLSAER
jgi:5-methylcytosine-specific restriction endonuclease McrA